MISDLFAFFRGLRLVLHVLAGLVLTFLFFRRIRPDSRLQRRVFQWWLKDVCRILKVEVRLRGTPRDDSFVVANHISWIDIPILASVWRGDFLAKEEVGGWPLLGRLVKRSGTVLIRRGCSRSFHEAVGRLQHRLRHGGGICMFPEGTTSDGHSIRRFQPRLFEAAIRTDAWVQPVALRYFDPDGNLHPHAPFIGDDDFVSHLIRLLRGPALRAEVIFLPRLSARGHAAKSLAEFAQWQVAEAMERQLTHGVPQTEGELLGESSFAL